MPATLGSIARRRAPEAARQRAQTTTATATQLAETSQRRAVSSAPASSLFAFTRRKLPSFSQNRWIESSKTNSSANAATSTRSSRDSSRPPVRNVSSSATNAIPQRSSKSPASTSTVGESIWLNTG